MRLKPRQILAVAALCGLTIGMPSRSPAQTDLLPDIIVREADLYDHDISTNIVAGRVHLRLSNGTPNIGLGPLTLIGQWPPADSGITVTQLIRRDDSTSWERVAGTFVFHPTHLHTHFEGWALYRIREWLPGNGVGAVLAESEKTSFCIADLAVYDGTLPNFDPDGEYFVCSNLIQGISVGWFDIYPKHLPSQNIDITDLPEGVYWLESVVDPENRILESDETNNTTRIKINLSDSAGLVIDEFEPNDSTAAVDIRPVGGFNSPNFGPTDPSATYIGLSIHESYNNDFYKFYAPASGTASDDVIISFQHSLGDLDLRLLDSAGGIVASSGGVSNAESVSLNGLPRGWYYVEVFGFGGVTNPNYSLTIDPPANAPPSVDVINPPVGNTERIHSFETYTVTWTATDPEDNLTWVTVYLNTTDSLDGNEQLLPSSLHTNGALGFYVVNSADFGPGTYWFYCAVTDGGSTTGSWSQGTVTFATATDGDGDAIYDFEDNCPYYPNPDQIGCISHGDPQPDGVTTIVDAVFAVDIAFRGGDAIVDSSCAHTPAGRTDVNCDGVTNALDVVIFIDVAFRGATHSFCDPCACNPYPDGCP